MQVEALFRDAKGGGFEWEFSRVLRAERAQRLPLGTPLAISCAVLPGEAAIRAGEIPAYGRSPHAVSLVRRGLDWLGAPARPRCVGGPSLHKKLAGYEDLHLVKWAGQQPWSDANIGMIGIS